MKRVLGWPLLAVGIVGSISSTVFLGLVIAGARRFFRDAAEQRAAEERAERSSFPPVSILKPLHGDEAGLEENLQSFFEQDYPKYEVLFAADTEDDKALPIARRVMARHPEISSRILVHGEPPWPNPPTYSFARMAEAARYEVLVTSDSDVRVDPKYLREVASPLCEANNGMVTCLYRGKNLGGLASALDAIGMSVEMTAGVLVANLMEGMKFGLGPTIAIRRDALDAIGGYQMLQDVFSNDFVIGNLVDEAGFRVVLSQHVIDHVVPPMTFRRMWQRQVRWATGTKFSRPKGHLGTVFVYSVPYGVFAWVGAALLRRPRAGLGIFIWTIVNRLVELGVAGTAVVRDPECARQPWLAPLRDLLGFAIWVVSYTGGPLQWRGGQFELVSGGKIAVRRRGVVFS